MRTRFAIVTATLATACALLASQTLAAAVKDKMQFTGKWNGAHSKIVKLYEPIWEEPFEEGWVRQPKGTVKDHGKEKFGTVIVSSGFAWDTLVIYENRINKGDKHDLKKGNVLQEIKVEGGVSGLSIADFNGDRKTDFAFARYHSNKVETYYGDGKGKFSKGAVLAVGKGPVEIITGDFDGSGTTDIATANVLDETISMLAGTGRGEFRAAETSRLPQEVAAKPLYALAAAGCADYSVLESALNNARMDSNNKRKLQHLVNQSKKAYNRNNSRRALDRLEKFLDLLSKMTDSKLTNATEANLRALVEGVIDEILNGCSINVTMTASPGAITAGGSATLTWTSTGAASGEIDNGVGAVTVTGSTPVSPSHTTTYTIIVTASDGATDTASATVTVGGVTDIIYVDANRGSDATGDGTPNNPYRTMTKGCSVAAASPLSPAATAATKTVLAAGGVYSADIGEVFPIYIPAGTILRGSGSSSTVIMGSGAYVSTSLGTSPWAVRMGNATEMGDLKVVGTGGASGVLVENVTATIKDVVITNCGANGVDVTESGYLTTEDSSFTDNSTHGIRVIDTARLYPIGCTFSGNGGAGVDMESTAPNVIDSQTFLNDAVWVTTGGPNVTVSNNTFTDTVSSPGAVASVLSAPTITNNSIQGNFGYGVLSVYFDAATVDSNTINGPDYGTWQYLVAYGTVSNNTITNCFRGVYSYYLDYTTITGNTISECGRGIRSALYSLAVVSGNQITGNGQGIQMSTYAFPTITGNSLTNNQIGISEFYYSDPTVTGNSIVGGSGGETGVYAALFAYGDFSSNTISGHSQYGAWCYYAVPDFDPVGGGFNTFSNLGTGWANLSNCWAGPIDAQNNTWNNVTPTTAIPCGATGVDIAEDSPGSVLY